MYANLRVTVTRGKRTTPHRLEAQDERVTVFAAWGIEYRRDHVRIFTDLNDGGSYADPGPTVKLPLAGRTINVAADF